MAVKWAVASGNWNATATWNDGVVPASGDYVYLNGHTVTYTGVINLGNGWLRNDANEDYGISAGGSLRYIANASMSIIANCYSATQSLINTYNASGFDVYTVNITGNCTCTSGQPIISSGTNTTYSRKIIIITGNVDASDGYVFGGVYFYALTINGNVIMGIYNLINSTMVLGGSTYPLTINGRISCIDGATGALFAPYIRDITRITIGEVDCRNGAIQLTTDTNATNHTLTIRGDFKVGGQFAYQTTMDVSIGGDLDCVVTNNSYIFSDTNNFTCNGNVKLEGTGALLNAQNLANGACTIYGDVELYGNTQLVRSYAYTLNLHSPVFKVANAVTPFGSITGILTLPDDFDIEYVGELPQLIVISKQSLANRQQYPPENEVKEGTEYAWGEKVGTYQQPPETVVLKDYVYDNGDKVGSLENQNIVGCVTKEDVREGVPLIGMYEDGQQVVGTIVIPAEEDVREGVHYDNNKVGTLIVQGGGDRLRIADFGYYTNAQSDTYIVDLTEQDKPKFAVAEERVLIEMFPDLDLENIPEKYFDDLFVKYLKYRLIVEYYRTAGINSTFTPSEPTTEIVNYQNVRNEVWLNSANIYLKAWAKKYPDCITRPQRILL